MAKRGVIALTILAALHSMHEAYACDLPFPAKGSIVSWPNNILAAKIEILSVNQISEIERLARVRVVQSLAGDLPDEFGVIYDTSSCGTDFKIGETRVAGLMALQSNEWRGDYRFTSNSMAETWAYAAFVSGWLTLRR